MGKPRPPEPLRTDWRTDFALQTGRQPLEPLPAILMLTARGLLLWLLVPAGLLAWIVASPWFVLKRISPGRLLGWLDLNLCVALQRGPLRPLIPQPLPDWIPANRISDVKHRVFGF